MTASEHIRAARIVADASSLYERLIAVADQADDTPETQEAYSAIEYAFDHLDTAIELLELRDDQ